MLGKVLYVTPGDDLFMEMGLKMDYEADEYKGTVLKEQFNSKESLSRLAKKDID